MMTPDDSFPPPSTTLRANLTAIIGRMDAARLRSLHAAQATRVVVVTKSVPTSLFEPLAQAGATDIGENRVQSASERLPDAPKSLRRHGIGPLQRNKAKRAIALFDEFHALDRIALAETLQRLLVENDQVWPVLLQVNTSEEAQKSGFQPDEALVALRSLQSFSQIRVRGWMTMAQAGAEEREVRRSFSTLRQLRDEALRLGIGGDAPSELSMGMSGDYVLAVEEGATMVRIGRAVFEGVTISS